jgi:hypothetical protein
LTRPEHKLEGLSSIVRGIKSMQLSISLFPIPGIINGHCTTFRRVVDAIACNMRASYNENGRKI